MKRRLAIGGVLLAIFNHFYPECESKEKPWARIMCEINVVLFTGSLENEASIQDAICLDFSSFFEYGKLELGFVDFLNPRHIFRLNKSNGLRSQFMLDLTHSQCFQTQV